MATSKPIDFCVECGGKSLFEEVSAVTHTLKGRQVIVSADRHMRCRDCEAVTYPGELLGAMMKAVANQIRQEDGLLAPNDLLAVRLRYGFTQAEMETLISAGEKTWVRWERGKVQQSKLYDDVIRRLDKDPAYVESLMRKQGIDNQTAQQVIDTALQRMKVKLRERVRSKLGAPSVSESALSQIIDIAYDSFPLETSSAFASRVEDEEVVMRRYCASVPVDVEAVALDLGLKVYRDPNLGRDISGKIAKDDELGGASGFAIWINQKDIPQRQRFTIAHEIAHFTLHRSTIGNGVTENALYRSDAFRAAEERAADEKAASILMPETLVRQAARETLDVVSLARRFDVSRKAMEIRLKELALT